MTAQKLTLLDKWARRGLLGLVLAGEAFGFLSSSVLADSVRAPLLWEAIVGNGRAARARAVASEGEEHIVLGGVHTPSRNADVLMFRLNRDGETVWRRQYGGSGYEAGMAVLATEKGNCVVVGSTASFGREKKGIYVLNVNKDGDVIWQLVFDEPHEQMGEAVCAAEGGVLVAGWAASPKKQDRDLLLSMVSYDGKRLWTKSHPGHSRKGELAQAIALSRCRRGGYVVGSTRRDNGAKSDSDFYVRRFDERGHQVWERTYGRRWDEEITGLTEGPDSRLVLVGNRSVGKTDNDIYIINTDAVGETQWELTLGGKRDDRVFDVQAKNGEYILTGWTHTRGAVETCGYIVGLSASGEMEWERLIAAEKRHEYPVLWCFGADCVAEDSIVVAGTALRDSKDLPQPKSQSLLGGVPYAYAARVRIPNP